MRGWGDYFWVDVVEKIDAMGAQVRAREWLDGPAGHAHATRVHGLGITSICPSWLLPAMLLLLALSTIASAALSGAWQANEFQTQAKKLPKALRDWAAYKDCRKTIDDFLALLPLFQSLAHRSIRER